jgi:hypothetical protein
MDNPPPVRFRIVLEVTFPEADPWDGSEHMEYLDQLQFALETANNVKCTDVKLREAGTVGVEDDDYGEWLRGSFQFAFFNVGPGTVSSFGRHELVPSVDPGDLGRVLQILFEAKNGELKENVAIAVGRAIKTDSNSNAVLARTYVLRVLQAKKLVPHGLGEDVLIRAASIPLRSAPMNESISPHSLPCFTKCAG